MLMAVAATFLTVSATSALAAQSNTPRASAAELAIEAAVPRPEPANVPPPTADDFKMDATASVPDASTKAAELHADRRSRRPKPAEAVTAPAKPTTPQPRDAASGGDRHCTRAAAPATEPVKAASTVAPADQPVADQLRDSWRPNPALFRPQGRTPGGREVLHRARIRAAVDRKPAN